MKTRLRRWIPSYGPLLLVSFLASGVVSGSAQPATAVRTAHRKTCGSGWACDPGYRMVDQACVAIAVPLTARLDSQGDGWECNRGYQDVRGSCAPVRVPKNAFLDAQGRRWECERGYRAVDDACRAIELPAHA